jgi:hypothetical protein
LADACLASLSASSLPKTPQRPGTQMRICGCCQNSSTDLQEPKDLCLCAQSCSGRMHQSEGCTALVELCTYIWSERHQLS